MLNNLIRQKLQICHEAFVLQGVNGVNGDKGDAGLPGPQGPSVSHGKVQISIYTQLLVLKSELIAKLNCYCVILSEYNIVLNHSLVIKSIYLQIIGPPGPPGPHGPPGPMVSVFFLSLDNRLYLSLSHPNQHCITQYWWWQ